MSCNCNYTPGTALEEAEIAFAHAFRIAEAAGFRRSGIVYIDPALIAPTDPPEVNALCADLFAERERPAHPIHKAAELPFSGKVKLQAIAARGQHAASRQMLRRNDSGNGYPVLN